MKSVLHCDSTKLDKHEFCDICSLAKQKRSSFISKNNLAVSTFDIVHVDIWGPFGTTSHAGYKSFLT